MCYFSVLSVIERSDCTTERLGLGPHANIRLYYQMFDYPILNVLISTQSFEIQLKRLGCVRTLKTPESHTLQTDNQS
jgi:hypothetical protein